MLHVVVPVHNRAAVTARFAMALAGQDRSDYALLLVDDGCTDDTVAVVGSQLPLGRLTVLRGNGQLWWAGALQLAYEHLIAGRLGDDDAVLIVNDDVSFAPDFLSRGTEVLREHPDACIQALGVDRATGTIDRGAVADVVRLRFRAAMPGEAANCLSTRGLLMSARTFRASGGFRPRWLPHYLSDYEYTLRVRRRGTPLLVDDRFRATVEFGLTGLSRPTASGPLRVWTDSLSNRAKFNPKHWTALVLLVCPVWIMPWHIVRIWGGFARALLLSLLPPGWRTVSR
ncbi:MAG: glycosyltransferase [Caldimonas sp.]